ncbi:sensor histidine kinase [Erythrobacter litoralis]|uniref:histidine kinase n=1 Tax=Erythrobacter litoralis (strain HTCC2594) TaxID=314225 RepID=Q2NAE5_ERYLH|nr:ATP-binding protein [Erythrobacter litoralis]ABC63346.1 two-component signal transduction histidine kinase [Erythrobacter litoralis HTCC2594]
MQDGDQTVQRSPRWWRQFVVASRRANLFRYLELACLLGVIGMIALTYATFTGAPPDGQLLPTQQVTSLLVGTLVPSIALLVLLGRRLALRRAAGSTARLHVRLVALFSIIAAVPTLMVAGFAAFLFQSGVDFWFSGQSRGMMDNVNSLAEGYFEQNQLDVAQQTQAMASDMLFLLEGRDAEDLTSEEFLEDYTYHMQARELNESAIMQVFSDGRINTAFAYGLVEGNDPAEATADALEIYRRGETQAVFANGQRIEAVFPIDRQAGVYLYNARTSESAAFSQWEQASDVVASYQQLTTRARALQLRFNLALFFVSLSLVGLAVWFALRFADRQVEPLTDLVAAARKVGAGNFALRVEGRTGADEIGLLNRAFNRMTAQLEKQTDALVSANQQLGDRRAFIETVLESVTAGVISTDASGKVLLMNSSAQSLLLEDPDTAVRGEALEEFAPEMAKLAQAGVEKGIINVSNGAELLTLAVKLAPASGGHVITFEDITRQLLDQRQAAWSDVARRIAHEIKNPLTPIQLATERLKRRYRKQIEADGELFDELTSTIVRQVGALRTMVDEFSSFARLPKPVFRPEDALDLLRQSLFLQEVGHPSIDFALNQQVEGPLVIECDRHQFGQALTNVLKNAAEAVDARAKMADVDFRGRIAVTISADDEGIEIAVEDNGVGLPQDRERIVEPYMTTREQGTGLGLAIVNKIVEEHGGDMSFAAAENGGTCVTLRFARRPSVPESEAAE